MRRLPIKLLAASRRRGAARTAVHGLLGAGAQVGDPSTAPEIKHVFIVVLENESADNSFAANSPAPYLAQTLRSQGAYLPNYYAIGHLSLDNYISMVSGQSPNPRPRRTAPAIPMSARLPNR